jgi:hypothetical protein
MIAATLIDDRGRVGGRVNVVDLAAAIVFLALIPLAFAAYALFRTPAPTLSRVTPVTLFQGEPQRIEIDGTNLRPFMRVSIDTVPARSFLLGSTKYAIVDLPDLTPGSYDVVLYDYMQEVARLRRALTVAPVPTDLELDVDGAFITMSDAAAATVKAGDKLPSADRPAAEVLSIGARSAGDLRLRFGEQTITVPQRSRNVPATLRVKCSTVPGPDGTARCSVRGSDQPIVVAPGALLAWTTAYGPLVFQIASARAPAVRSNP